MKIAIGSDHRGFELKEKIKAHFISIKWIDVGTTDSVVRVDYPDYAHSVCDLMIKKEVDLGILLCGSGIGMALAANRYPEVLAGNCWSVEIARLARAHDHINLLVLPADFVAVDQSFEIVQTWLQTELLEGRYVKRLEKL